MAEKQLDLFPDKNKSKLKINPNATPETNLGDFQEQGGYQDEKKPFRDLNPRRKGTPVVRGKKAKEKQQQLCSPTPRATRTKPIRLGQPPL